MSEPRHLGPDRLPTLTEVLEPGRYGQLAPQPPPALLMRRTPDDLVAAVLLALMPRLDELLETRLREALAPALARAADGLIRDSREELASVLRELVQEAVTRELNRPN